MALSHIGPTPTPYVLQPRTSSGASMLPKTDAIAPMPSTARTTPYNKDLDQLLLQAEATRPAAKAQHMALKLIIIESSASVKLTPPRSKGIAATGRTASQSVRARSR